MTTTKSYDSLNRLTQISSAPSAVNSSPPKVIEVSGTTSDDASVASIASDGSHAAGVRQGTYFHTEVPIHNNAGPQWLSLTNYALRTNAPGSIYTTDSRQVFVPATPEQFTYDAAGNLTSDGRWIYGWDAENRLTNMTALSSLPTGAKLKLDFVYDWQGRRIQKLVSTNNGSAYGAQYTNKFVYDGWNLIAVLGPQSSVLQSFLWGLDLSGSMQGAGGVGGLLAISDQSTINHSPSTHFVAFDGNGNVAALVNAADGTVSAQYEYGPFGEVLRESGLMAKADPFRFSTKYQDETDLMYYGHRYLNATTGRWLSRDPVGERGGINQSCFVDNDGVCAYDKLGLATVPTADSPAPIMLDPDRLNDYNLDAMLGGEKVGYVEIKTYALWPGAGQRSRGGWMGVTMRALPHGFDCVGCDYEYQWRQHVTAKKDDSYVPFVIGSDSVKYKFLPKVPDTWNNFLDIDYRTGPVGDNEWYGPPKEPGLTPGAPEVDTKWSCTYAFVDNPREQVDEVTVKPTSDPINSDGGLPYFHTFTETFDTELVQVPRGRKNGGKTVLRFTWGFWYTKDSQGLLNKDGKPSP